MVQEVVPALASGSSKWFRKGQSLMLKCSESCPEGGGRVCIQQSPSNVQELTVQDHCSTSRVPQGLASVDSCKYTQTMALPTCPLVQYPHVETSSVKPQAVSGDSDTGTDRNSGESCRYQLPRIGAVYDRSRTSCSTALNPKLELDFIQLFQNRQPQLSPQQLPSLSD